MMRSALAAVFLLTAPPVLGRSDPFDVSMTVVNDTELSRFEEVVSHGLPVPRGRLEESDLELLFITAPDGTEVPSQFRILARWVPGTSIKHLLVTFPATVPASSETVYRIRRGATPRSYSGRVAEADRARVLQLFETDQARAILTDPFGTRYPLQDPVAEIEQAGPIETIIRLDGYHVSEDTSGIGRDFLWSTAYFTFHDGVEAIRIDWYLKNSYTLRPMGGVRFEDFRLELRHHSDSPVAYLGDPPLLQSGLPAAASYLDGTPRPILFAWGGDPSVNATIAVLDAWQTFPNTVEVDETFLRYECLPNRGTEYFLEDGQHVQFRCALILNHEPSAAVARAQRFERPLLCRLDGEYLQSTRAWGDFGAFQPVPIGTDLPFAGWANVTPGWNAYGEEVRSTHQGGSPRNRYSYLLNYMQTGEREHFEWVEDHCNVSMNLRPYHWSTLEAPFDADDFPGDFLRGGHWVLTEEGPGARARLSIPPDYDPWRTTASHGWNGWDFEHMTVDDLRDYHLVTGHPKAREALLEIAEGLRSYGMCFDPQSYHVHSGRVMGWVLRALLEAYRLSGEEKYFRSAASMVRSALLRNGQRWVFDEHGAFRGSEPFLYRGQQRFGLHNHNDFRPWMSAVGGVGLMLFLNLLEEREQAGLPVYFDVDSAEVRTLIVQTADLILDLGLRPGEGFIYQVDIYDESPSYEGFTGGTATWNLELLALVARMTGDWARYLEPARFAFEDAYAGQDRPGDPWFQVLQETLPKMGASPDLYLSFSSTFDLRGLGIVEPSDVVRYDASRQAFETFVDGSDIGLDGVNLRAFEVLANGWMLLSFDDEVELPGLFDGPNGESVTPQDVVLFKPTQTGDETAGSFVFVFDGSDVGLAPQDRIDAMTLAFGALLVSFEGEASLPGATGLASQDIAFFLPMSIGSTTTGFWGLAFDGSDVGLAEDGPGTAGLSLGVGGQLLMMSDGSASQDVFRFDHTSLGRTTAGSFEKVLSGPILGLPEGTPIRAISRVW